MGDDDDASGDDDDATGQSALVTVLNSGPEAMGVVAVVYGGDGQKVCTDLAVGAECSAEITPGTAWIEGESVGGCTVQTPQFTVAAGEAHTQELVAADFTCP